jgi:hypothetical protein
MSSWLRTLRRRFFGGAALSRTPIRRHRRQPLVLEYLETRVVPATQPPRILSVTPPNFSSQPGNNPSIVITFSEAMKVSDATNAANYLLFANNGNKIGITGANLNYQFNPGPGTSQVTISGYNNGNTLLQGTYSLFVKGDQLHDGVTGTTTLAEPGQLLAADLQHHTVSTINNFGQSPANTTLYSAPQSYSMPTFETAAAVTLGDFNGDGVLDVAVADKKNDKVYVYLAQTDANGNATGAFSATPNVTLTLPAGALSKAPGGVVQPDIMTVGDITGDTVGSTVVPDLVVADPGTNQVTVFKNQTTNSNQVIFSNGTGTTYFAGQDPVGVVAGDFDGNGTIDLAVADGKVDNNGNLDVTVLSGNGGGTFAAGKTITTGFTSGSLTGIAGGSGFFLSGTGTLPDLAVVGSSGFVALLNTTTTAGNFKFSKGNVVAGNFNSVSLGSLTSSTSSTALDAGVINIAAGPTYQFQALQNDGAGNFSVKATVNLNGPATSVQLADVNGDNLSDVLVASSTQNAVTALINTSGGASVTFANPVNYAVDTGPVGLAVGTLNGGAALDVVSVNTTTSGTTTPSSFTALLGTGKTNPAFAEATTVTEASNTNPTSIAVGDLNGDGFPDYVVADSGANQVEVYLSNGNGTYQAPAIYSTLDFAGHGQKPVSVTLANLTGRTYANGLPILDIVTADAGPDGTGKYYVSVLQNLGNGQGTFNALATAFQVGQSPTAVAALTEQVSGGKVAQDLLVSHNGSAQSPIARGVTLLVNSNTSPSPTIAFAAGKELATPPSVATSFAPTALAVGDFNRDGNNDFVILNSSISPSIELFDGNGQGSFTLVGNFALNQNLVPSGIAVGDFAANGYLDVAVIASKSGDPGHAVIETLLNALGNAANTANSLGGFQSTALLSPALPFGATGNSLAVVNSQKSPYPSLIVGSNAAVSLPALTVDNLFVLPGVGNGTFANPVPYEVAGNPTTTTVAVASDPIVPVLTFFKSGQLVSSDLIVNGTFNGGPNGELTGETGNLDGWQTASLKDSHGQWTVMQKATPQLSPLSQTAVFSPPFGLQNEAILDAWNLAPLNGFFVGFGGGLNADGPETYAGSNFLYQDITIPANATQATLTMRLYLNNTVAGAWFPGDPGDPLNYNLPNTPDQQVAVDIVDPNANVTFAPSQLSIFNTSSNPPNEGFVDVSANLLSFAGKTIRLRIAGVDNQGNLIVGVDNVKLQTTFADTTGPSFSSLRVRNPGTTVGANNTAVTTDPTIVGAVSDAAGLAGIAFVQVDPTNSGFLGPQVITTNQFDALGNFSVTIPNLSFGLHTIAVRVTNLAGSSFTVDLSMFYQGPSNTGFQAVGPSGNTGGIATNPAAVGFIYTYTSVSGRVTATAIDPSDPSGNTIYAGSENGGVWKSTDGGANWTPLTDFIVDQKGNPVNVPVGALAIAKSSPNIVYVATGDGNTLSDAIGGIGVLKSVNSGLTWSVVGNSGTFLANARVTAMAVDPSNPNKVYVAVASGVNGPGVYRSLDGGLTWTNILSTGNMAAWPNNNGATTVANFDPSIALGSVTSLILDPFNPSQIIIGIGNIELAPTSATAGVWITANADSATGVSWTPILGGNNNTFADSTGKATNFVPGGPASGLFFSQWPGVTSDPAGAGTALGRVTVAEGFGRGPNQSYFYVLVGTPSTATQPLTGGNVDFGNGTTFGLYKSSDGGPNWTNVKLMDQTNFQVDGNGVASPLYSRLNLLGHDAANAAVMIVDGTDPNVVYIGGSVGYDPVAANINNIESGDNSHGLVEVDTGDMLDATTAGIQAAINIVIENNSWGGSLTLNQILNNSDDIEKEWIANDSYFKTIYDTTSAPISGSGSFKYIFEGVSWYDLSNGEYDGFGAPYSVAGQLPAEVLSLTQDPQGRLLVGTEKGLWRTNNHGIGYDYTTGGLSFGFPGFGVIPEIGFTGMVGEGAFVNLFGGPLQTYSTSGNLVDASPPPANVSVTTLNGNMQITDVSSVAVDPYLTGTYYVATNGTGTARTMTDGSLSWQTMGIVGPVGQTTHTSPPIFTPDGPDGTPNGIFSGVEDATSVFVGAADPNAAPGTPATVYSTYAYQIPFSLNPNPKGYVTDQILTLGPDFVPLSSALGGLLTPANSSFQEKFAGIAALAAGETAGYLPAMAIDPVKVNHNGQLTDELLFGTSHIYESFNGDQWNDLNGGQALTSPGEFITAEAISPSNPNFLYVGTSLGRVFVTQVNGGVNNWPESDSGLPVGQGPVSSFAINPSNPLIAYVTYSGFGGFNHVFATSDGGKTWKSIVGNLPNVAIFSFVTDPRPSAGAPQGYLYAGTQVGLFYSVNGGATWQKLGTLPPGSPVLPSLLPNVPILSLDFNQSLEQLVVGTQGRGVFVISTAHRGPFVVSDTPTTPVAPGSIGSITVTFNHPIAASSFTTNQVHIVGPGGVNIPVGTITDITPTPLGKTNPHNVWQITFPTLTTIGTYTITIGPDVTDLVGNPMDQNGNGINGEASDVFTMQIAVNADDDGRFVSGLYNDILGRSVSTSEFLTQLGIVDGGRFGALPGFINAYMQSSAARTQLITELYKSSASPLSSIGLGNFVGSVPGSVPTFVNMLNSGASLESIIDTIVGSPLYFLQTANHNINGIDANFLTALWNDLLGRNPTSSPNGGEVKKYGNQLLAAEINSRFAQVNSLIESALYFNEYTTQGSGLYLGGYQGLLGRAPSTFELNYWAGQFAAGVTQQTFIATLIGSGEFFNRAPTILPPGDPDFGQPPTNRSFVKAAFLELFPNFTPNGAQVSFWVNKIVAGESRAQVALDLMANTNLALSPSWLFDPNNGIVAQYYQAYLGRLPNSGEISAWQTQFQNGLRVETFLAYVVSGTEFYNKITPPPTPLPTSDDNWVKAVYSQLTGSPPTSGQESAMDQALSTAETLARQAVAGVITSSTEFRQRLVTLAYNNYLKRGPSAAELANGVALLSQPSAGPGMMSRDEQLIAGILAKPEYFYLQTDSSNNLHDNTSWMDSLYTALQIPFNPTQATNNVAALIADYAGQRQQVINSLLTSAEYRGNIVKKVYSYFIDRQLAVPSPTELQAGINALASGMTDEQFTANIMGSPEYFQFVAPLVVGTTQVNNTTFVKALYLQLTPYYQVDQATINFWVSELNAHAMTLAQVAFGVITSYWYRWEPTNGLINRSYLHYLGRNASAQEISIWKQRFLAGTTDEQFFSVLVDSQEYFQRTHTFP